LACFEIFFILGEIGYLLRGQILEKILHKDEDFLLGSNINNLLIFKGYFSQK